MSEFEPQIWIIKMTPELTPEISDSMEIGKRGVCPLTATYTSKLNY